MLPLSIFPPTPEIIQLICNELLFENSTLSSLARTSKMFEAPALDVLWYELGEFYPLVTILSSDSWSENDNGEDGRLLVLERHLTPADCSRYLYYASKVRHYRVDIWESRFTEVQIDAEVYQSLQFVLPGGKLLPNIRQLTWSYEIDPFPFLDMFMGHFLEKIAFEFSPTRDMHLSVIAGLHTQYPSLKWVSFTFSYHFEGIATESRRQAIEVISSAVCMWKDLQSLTVESLTYSALMAVSRLPYLNTLEICDWDFEPSTAEPRIASGGFKSLNTLMLSLCVSASACYVVLESMECSPVNTMCLEFREALVVTDWKQVFLTINLHCHHDSLTSLNCKDHTAVGRRPTVSEIPHRDLNEEIIKSLFAFQNITFLDFEAVRGFDIAEPDAIEKMAKHWRKIQTLKIKQRPFFRVKERYLKLCISDLVPFAKYCPDLEELGLVFNACSLQSVIGTKSLSKSRLSQLCVSISPVDNPDTVAASLSAMFPSLKNINTVANDEKGILDSRIDDSQWGDDHKMWKHVERLVKTFIAFREQTLAAAMLES